MIAWTDTNTDAPHGEALVVNERLVLAPCGGRFRPAPTPEGRLEGEYVLEGQVVGNVASSGGAVVPIRSRFAGWMMGYLLPDGAPVRSCEPVLWLRRH